MKLLQNSEIKSGCWRSGRRGQARFAIAFVIVTVGAGFINSQKAVGEVAKISSIAGTEMLLEHQTVIKGDLSKLAAIEHDDDDIGRKKEEG